MKTLFYIVTILALLVLPSCYEKRSGPEQVEKGWVVSKNFTPAHSETTYGPKLDMDGKLRNGYTTKHYPDKWEITFRCDHGKWTIGDDKAQRLFPVLQENKEVYIKYKEWYYVDKKENYSHADFQFLDASHQPFAPNGAMDGAMPNSKGIP